VRTVVFRLVLAFVGIVTALALAEGVLRLMPALDPHLGGHERLFTFDDTLGWRFRAGVEETIVFPGEYRRVVRINESGFRDVPWTRDGERRVAILGDSFTSNLGVPVDSMFTRHLERRLGPDAVVRNYGVNGYNQVQELVLLDTEVLAWKPDLVLVVVYPRNDLDENVSRYWTARYDRPRAELAEGQLEIDTKVREHDDGSGSTWIEGLRLRVLARTLWYRMRPEAIPVHRIPPERRWSRTTWGADEQQAFDLTVETLTWMHARCEEVGVDFGVVLAPSLWQVRDDAWKRIARDDMVRTEPQATLAKILEAWGLDVLDLLPSLRAVEGRLYYPSEQHWTPAAQRPVAAAIAERWIEDVPPRR